MTAARAKQREHTHIHTGQLLDHIRRLAAEFWLAPTADDAQRIAVQLIDAIGDLDEVLQEGAALPTEWARATP